MLETCVDSGASNNYSPDQNKFSNYKEINRDITTANGHVIKAMGTGDLHLDLPNGSKMMKVIFKNAVHSPMMASTLLSISKLDLSGHKVIFHNQMCMIQDTKGQIIGKIPYSQGLYQVLIENEKQPGLHTNAATKKMSISEAHIKLGHISSAAIRHAVSKVYITGICLDEDSKPEFCDTCAKAKSACQPFPKELKN